MLPTHGCSLPRKFALVNIRPMSSSRRSFLSFPAFGLLLIATAFPCDGADQLRELRGVFRASFNHDASRVVVRGREGAVTIWELPMGTPVIGDLDPKAESNGFLVSADGKMVAISFSDSRCRVFDPGTAKAI